ncbi:aldo/keto reductase [Lactobacillaceae bacterium L1_55_11]|nr:aldo/keto reductase [Lactobacillaceae bacterium L1_55_11]
MTERILDQDTTLSNGVQIPKLGMGVWKSSNAQADQAVQTALANGYRLIDTAKQYGNQLGVGAGLKKSFANSNLNRKDIFVTTKVFNGDQGYDSTLHAFEQQLKDLQLQYVDMYLIHWPVDGKYLDTWKAMERLYKDGKIRAIGISNFDIERMQDVLDHAEIMPQVNQMEFNPLVQEKDIYQFMREVGMTMEAWGPLGGGQAINDPVIQELAKKHQKTPAQIILRFDVQMGVVTIPKSIHDERIIANSQLDGFELSPEDMAAIQQLDRNQRSLWYEDFTWHTPHKDSAAPDEVSQWDDNQEYQV